MSEQTEPEPKPPSASAPGIQAEVGGDLKVDGNMVGRDYNLEQHFYGDARPETYAQRADYLAQFIARYQDLDLVGIPELKDRDNLRLEDVFIPLATSQETELDVLRVDQDWVVEADFNQSETPEIQIGGSLIVKNGTLNLAHPDLRLEVGAHIIVLAPARLNVNGSPGGRVKVGSDVLILAAVDADPSQRGGININVDGPVDIGGDLNGGMLADHPRFPFYRQYLDRAGSRPYVGRVKRSLNASAYVAIRQQARVVILGNPGSGKTTLLKYVALAFARGQSQLLELDETRLPIFVRLYDYVAKRPRQGERGFSLVDYLYLQARENLQVRLEPGFFEQELQAGRCCVCLDGLDELGDSSLRREVVEQVAALIHRYPANRYLVSSRIVGYQEAPLDRRDLAHLTLLPLGPAEVETFITRWYAARERDPLSRAERTAHLIRTVTAEPGLASLAANPLLLTIIALVHRIEAELPNERVKLYDKCVTALIETWEKVKNLSLAERDRPYYKYRRRLLEQLAFWLHSQPGSQGRTRDVKVGTLRQKLAEFLLQNRKLDLDQDTAWEEAGDFVRMVQARTGLLIEHGDGVYAFPHLTFQEYLAACDIEKRFAHSVDAIWETIEPRLHDPAWREVVLLLLGSLNRYDEHPSELLRRLLARADEYEPVLHRNLLLAARALVDHVEVDSRLRQEVVRRLVEVARGDPFNARDALYLLGEMRGLAPALAAALALAQDEALAPDLRWLVLRSIEPAASPDALGGVLRALAASPAASLGLRQEAANWLAEIGQPRAALANWLSLLDAPDASVGFQREVLRRLGQFQPPGPAAAALRAWSPAGRAPQAQLEQALALGSLGEAGEALARLAALAGDPQAEASVRREAALALGQRGQADQAEAVLVELARDPARDDFARREAASALAQLPRREAALAELSALARAARLNGRVRHEAALAVRELGDDELAAQLLLALACDTESSDVVRRQAALDLRADVNATESQSVQACLAVLNDTALDTEAGLLIRVQMAAELNVFSLRFDGLEEFLAALVEQPRMPVSVRLQVARLYAERGDMPRALAIIDQALERDRYADSSVLEMLTAALDLPDHQAAALARLGQLARHPELGGAVCLGAIRALGRRGQETGALLQVLAAAPRADFAARREAARDLLTMQRPEEAAPLLLALARDDQAPDGPRRESLQDLIQANQSTPTILDGLAELAADAGLSANLRCAALHALGKLGRSETAARQLAALVRDPDAEMPARQWAHYQLSLLLAA